MRKIAFVSFIFLTVYAGIRGTSYFRSGEPARYCNLLYGGNGAKLFEVENPLRKTVISSFGGFTTPNPYGHRSFSFNRHFTEKGSDRTEKVIGVLPGDVLEFNIDFPLKHRLVMAQLEQEDVPVSLNGNRIPWGAVMDAAKDSILTIGPFAKKNIITSLLLEPVLTDIQKNVIFIVLDAYRAENLNLGITPNLSRLSRDSVRFHKHYVNASWTRPSTMVFFTGKYASRTIINFWDYPVAPEERKEFYQSNIEPLPAIFARNGYASIMIGNNPFLTDRRYMGVDTGFESVADFSIQEKDTPMITAAASEAIHKLSKEKRPFFFFLNYNDPHAPYDPPPEILASVEKKLPSHYPEKRKKYLAEAAYTDRELGKFLDVLKEKGLYDSAMIVVTSDHGEIMDPRHGYSKFTGLLTLYGHGQGLYNEDIHTPLIIKYPDGENAGKEIPFLTRSIDILPTILEVVGLPLPAKLDGKLLTDLITEKEKGDRFYYGETRGAAAVIQNNMKLQKKTFLFHRPGISWDGTVGKDEDFLFDLQKDPQEVSPLFSKDRNGELNSLLDKNLPLQNSYGVRFTNPSKETSASQFRFVVSVDVGKLVIVSGKGQLSADGKKLIFSEKLDSGHSSDFRFRVYPDVSFPQFTSWVDNLPVTKGNWGVGELDVYPGNCTVTCEELYLANHQPPSLPTQRRIQFWKTGHFTNVEKIVLEKGTLDILKKQGYIQ